MLVWAVEFVRVARCVVNLALEALGQLKGSIALVTRSSQIERHLRTIVLGAHCQIGIRKSLGLRLELGYGNLISLHVL